MKIIIADLMSVRLLVPDNASEEEIEEYLRKELAHRLQQKDEYTLLENYIDAEDDNFDPENGADLETMLRIVSEIGEPEGWVISRRLDKGSDSEPYYELQRIDEQRQFISDEEAVYFVIDKAFREPGGIHALVIQTLSELNKEQRDYFREVGGSFRLNKITNPTTVVINNRS